jgi:NADH:ubiquinone reductase (H+-translocating)
MQTREEPRREVTFEPDPYAASLDLGPGGAVVTIGWDRLVHLTDRPAGEGLQADGQFSVGLLPVDDAEAILTAAHYKVPRPDLV